MQCDSHANGACLVIIRHPFASVVSVLQHFAPGKHRDGWLVTFANQSPRSRLFSARAHPIMAIPPRRMPHADQGEVAERRRWLLAQD